MGKRVKIILMEDVYKNPKQIHYAGEFIFHVSKYDYISSTDYECRQKAWDAWGNGVQYKIEDYD